MAGSSGSRPTMNEKRDPFNTEPINRLIADTSRDIPPAPPALAPAETVASGQADVEDGGEAKEPPKEKVTVLLPRELLERLRDASWTLRKSLAFLAEAGIRKEVEKLEKENGGKFKPREEDLKPGRPQGSRNGKSRIR